MPKTKDSGRKRDQVLTRVSPPAEPWRDPVLGPCACSQLRRTSRALSSLYDEFLLPAGLTVTQYAILVTIARAGALQRTQLAERLGMERTTLTRNLRPLERECLVAEKPGADRRQHQVTLTDAGRQRLETGFQCWAEVQEQFLASIGPDRMAALSALLTHAAEAAAATAQRKARTSHI